MSVGVCQLRDGVIWNADDCRRAEARIARLEDALREVITNNGECETGDPDGFVACRERWPDEEHLWCPSCVARAALAEGDDRPPCKGSDLHCETCGAPAKDVEPEYRFDPTREAIQWTCFNDHRQITGWRPKGYDK